MQGESDLQRPKFQPSSNKSTITSVLFSCFIGSQLGSSRYHFIISSFRGWDFLEGTATCWPPTDTLLWSAMDLSSEVFISLAIECMQESSWILNLAMISLKTGWRAQHQSIVLDSPSFKFDLDGVYFAQFSSVEGTFLSMQMRVQWRLFTIHQHTPLRIDPGPMVALIELALWWPHFQFQPWHTVFVIRFTKLENFAKWNDWRVSRPLLLSDRNSDLGVKICCPTGMPPNRILVSCHRNLHRQRFSTCPIWTVRRTSRKVPGSFWSFEVHEPTWPNCIQPKQRRKKTTAWKVLLKMGSIPRTSSQRGTCSCMLLCTL